MNESKIDGNYVVTRNETFNGMITGRTTVKGGAKFINCGMLCNDVIVEENASFVNRGMVTGNIIGEGSAEIWGMVNGKVSSTLNIFIHKDSVINGTRYKVDEITA